MNDIDKQALGDRIREARKQVGMTQGEFSKMLGINVNYVSMLECGSKNPSERLLKRVADATGVSLDWLKTGHEISETEKTDFSEDHEPESKENFIEKRAPESFKVNCRLLLSLALLYTNHTKETLAKKLDVRPMVIDRILNTKGSYVEEAWIPALYEIAAELDPSVMEGEFSRMRQFVREANYMRDVEKLMIAVCDYYYANGVELEHLETEKSPFCFSAECKEPEMGVQVLFLNDTSLERLDEEKVRTRSAAQRNSRVLCVTTSYGVFLRIKDMLSSDSVFANWEVLLWDRQRNEIVKQAQVVWDSFAGRNRFFRQDGPKEGLDAQIADAAERAAGGASSLPHEQESER